MIFDETIDHGTKEILQEDAIGAIEEKKNVSMAVFGWIWKCENDKMEIIFVIFN